MAGLEDYSVDRLGSLKASAVHRRQNAIRAVLFEQELQVRRHRLIVSASKAASKKRPTPRHRYSVLDHVKLVKLYQDQTEQNIHQAISKGRFDSEEALAIYRERSSLRNQAQAQVQAQRKRPLLVLPSLTPIPTKQQHPN